MNVPTATDATLLDSKSVRWFAYWLIIVTAAVVTGVGIYQAAPLQSANDRSRWCTVYSLVEKNTYQIDRIIEVPGWDTIDKVRHEDHFYSSKPPLLPTVVAGVYWSIRETTGWTLPRNTARVTRLTLLLVNLVPMAIALILIARALEHYALRPATRLFVLTAAGFATFLTPFSTTLNNHTVAAWGVVFSLIPLLALLTRRSQSGWLFAATGFFAAWTVTNELPAALFGVATFLLLARHDFKRTMLFYVPAALLPLAAFFVTNYWQTGGIKPFYAYYGTEKYRYYHEGVPSYWIEPRGLDKAIDSPLAYFLHCTIGHHGIFSLTPIYLFSLIGCIIGVRGKHALQTLVWLTAGLTAAVLLFYMSRTSNYNYGGNTAGLRWTFWLIPFWLFAMIPALDRLTPARGVKAFAILAIAVSSFSALSAMQNPWSAPWLYTVMNRAGWIDYRDQPEPLPRTMTTWFSTIPEDEAWIELTAIDSLGNEDRLRLSTTGSPTGGVQRIAVEGNSLPEAGPIELKIDLESFRAGDDPAEFLVEEDRPEINTLLRGLPTPRPYQVGFERHVKTPLRSEAFRCPRAASQVTFKPTLGGPQLRYRCDVWYSDEVPFGVIRFDRTISDVESGEVLWSETRTATAASRVEPFRPLVTDSVAY